LDLLNFCNERGIYEIWSSGNSIEQCLEHARKLANDPKMQKYFSPDLKFCARVRAYGKKFQTAEKLEIIHTFIANLPFKAKVDLDNPDFEIWILMDYGMAENKPDQPLKRVFFTRRICKSAREELLDDYALNKRKYIGTTSTKAELAFLMANQALVKPGSLVYDPFVGTGSIIISCAVFGALVYGSDIDIRVLKGNGIFFENAAFVFLILL
jgi:tRNA (guanine10-N2)-methyltransferase